MNDNFNLNKVNIIANVSYCNISNKYMIGLWIGKIYTILEDKFKTKDDAIDFLYDNFEYTHSV
jgi:hypothetical protein